MAQLIGESSSNLADLAHGTNAHQLYQQFNQICQKLQFACKCKLKVYKSKTINLNKPLNIHCTYTNGLIFLRFGPMLDHIFHNLAREILMSDTHFYMFTTIVKLPWTAKPQTD